MASKKCVKNMASVSLARKLFIKEYVDFYLKFCRRWLQRKLKSFFVNEKCKLLIEDSFVS